MIDSVQVVYAPVRDMDRAVALFRDVLGLTPEGVSPYWSSFRVGGLVIALHPSKAAQPSRHGWVLCLGCDNLAAMRARVEEAGFTGTSDYHETPNGVIWSFQDADGNSIDLMQPGSNLSDF